jgi:DNA-binding transcriptional MerR regulator
MRSKIYNETINQHFLAQVEQRLNAANPAALPENQRIYEFEIMDRDARILRLVKDSGRSIEKTLSILDLFSFDVDPSQGVRANFEGLFERYERNLSDLTAAVMQNDASVAHNAMYPLFLAKMVNFIRNPYSIHKVLNTFGALATVHPTDLEVCRVYERILHGRRPQQKYLCDIFGITDEQYGAWLRVIFLLLERLQDGHANMLEQCLSNLYFAKDVHTTVGVYRYGTERCLLCDRGTSTPLPQEQGSVFDFNLRGDAFIRYGFYKFNASILHPPAGVVASIMRGPKFVRADRHADDLFQLGIFNQRVVDQAHSRVFCATKAPYGVTIAPTRLSDRV